MAEAKKKAAKAKKEAELTAETVVENESPEVKVETKLVNKKKKISTVADPAAEPVEIGKNQAQAPPESENEEHATKPPTDKQAVKTNASATAKAGKRSAKAIAEAEEKEAKETRKASKNADPEKSKVTKRPARSRLERAGKKYREVAKLIDKEKIYSVKDALELVVKTSPVKFDATVEMHINLNVDPRQADQNVRDTVVLPAGTGKTVRIAVMADEDEAKTANAAGADIAGEQAITAQLEKEQLDFDVLIATPAQMPKLGKYARLLGPRGLMPNPKSGTVTSDIAKAVAEAKAGKVEYRVDQAGIVHLGIGKVSFGADKLNQNSEAITTSIKSARPSGIKGNYVKAAFITSTMGPSIRFEI